MNDNKTMNPPSPYSAHEWGTVGWQDDGGKYYDLGSAENDGRTLVRVTLFRGRDGTTLLDNTQAQGHKLLCQIGGGFFRIPPKGTPVLVAIPHPHGLLPGGSCIIATSETSPVVQFAKDRVVMDFGPDTHVVIRAKSVTLQSYSTPAQFVSVGQPYTGGKPGVYAIDETGSGFATQSGECAIFSCDGNGHVQSTCHCTSSTAEILHKGTQTCGFQATSGNANCCGANLNATCGKVYLGNPASTTPASGCLYGPAPGATSTAVFVASA